MQVYDKKELQYMKKQLEARKKKLEQMRTSKRGRVESNRFPNYTMAVYEEERLSIENEIDGIMKILTKINADIRSYTRF